ncbi:MAG: phosphate acyltransferase PlsX [Candidatus Firestonebacteria bacterium]
MKISLDAMGGDNAPRIEVEGAIEAAREFGLEVVLVGDKERITAEINNHKVKGLPISICHASQIINMHESPTDAYKQKKDSSLLAAIKLVKEGKADAVVSAGNTGAVMATALFELGRIKGVSRPAIATLFPSVQGKTLFLDVGANADCKPKHLMQFAIMGSIYFKYLAGIDRPRVALLSVGEEEKKGNELVIETAKLIRKTDLNFIGNVEGRDILGDKADVIVCDGFIGNVVLKFGESFISKLFKIFKKELENSSIFISFGAMLISPVLKSIVKRMDYSEYGSAPLLGINAPCFISHGSSNVKAIKNAIKTAADLTSCKVVSHIEEEISKYMEENNGL